MIPRDNVMAGDEEDILRNYNDRMLKALIDQDANYVDAIVQFRAALERFEDLQGRGRRDRGWSYHLEELSTMNENILSCCSLADLIRDAYRFGYIRGMQFQLKRVLQQHGRPL